MKDRRSYLLYWEKHMLFGNVYLLIQLLLFGQIDRLVRKQTYLLLIRLMQAEAERRKFVKQQKS